MRPLVALAVLTALAIPAHATSLLRTRSGASVRWETADISVAVEPASHSRQLGADSVLGSLEGAVHAWNALPEMKVRFVASVQAPAVVVRFCKDVWKNPAGLLAHTEFQADTATGKVAAAVIEVNECDFRFVGPDEVAEGTFDLQSVLTHELGHVLGLGHSADPTAVMFTSTGSVRQRRPTLDDRAGVVALFGGAPAVAPPSAMPAGPATPAPVGPAVVTRVGAAAGDPIPPARNPVLVNAPATKPPGAAARPGRTGAPPENVLAAVRLGADDGPGIMLYTCEPTVLPAIARIGQERPPAPPSPKAKKARAAPTRGASASQDAWQTWLKEAAAARKSGQRPGLPGL